jgi:hypothetical protein
MARRSFSNCGARGRDGMGHANAVHVTDEKKRMEVRGPFGGCRLVSDRESFRWRAAERGGSKSGWCQCRKRKKKAPPTLADEQIRFLGS